VFDIIIFQLQRDAIACDLITAGVNVTAIPTLNHTGEACIKEGGPISKSRVFALLVSFLAELGHQNAIKVKVAWIFAHYGITRRKIVEIRHCK
jgi:hypothetical protein